jgi:hypothetical protein
MSASSMDGELNEVDIGWTVEETVQAFAAELRVALVDLGCYYLVSVRFGGLRVLCLIIVLKRSASVCT